MGGPGGDKWSATEIQSTTTSANVLDLLNNSTNPVTAAFVATLEDGTWLFTGSYPDSE